MIYSKSEVVEVQTWLNTSNVEDIYCFLRGSTSGMSGFMARAKAQVATRGKKGYMYKDLNALWNLFQNEFSTILFNRRIECMNELIQRTFDRV